MTILRTIMFGAAMLGATACHKAKPAATTPTNTSTTPTDPKADPTAAKPTPPPATPTAGPDPCGG